MRMRLYCPFVVVGLALIAAAQTGTRKQPAPIHTIIIKDFAFVPDHLTVSVGDTVVWKNEDSAAHTATAENVFDSNTLNTGQSWSFIARPKGDYHYICTYHPTMKGELTIQ